MLNVIKSAVERGPDLAPPPSLVCMSSVGLSSAYFCLNQIQLLHNYWTYTMYTCAIALFMVALCNRADRYIFAL